MDDFIFLPSDCARKEICTFNIIIHFVISSSTFKSRRTNKSYTIFHEVNCSSTYVICPMECTLCKKQYVRKSETSFNIRLNNHHKDVKKPDAMLACRHFQKKSRFQQTCKVHHYK